MSHAAEGQRRRIVDPFTRQAEPFARLPALDGIAGLRSAGGDGR